MERVPVVHADGIDIVSTTTPSFATSVGSGLPRGGGVACIRREMRFRKVDVRLPGKGNSNSHGARPVHLIISMIKWTRTSRLSIKNSLSER